MLECPTDILKTYLNEEVTFILKKGEVVNCILLAFDEHMNLLTSTIDKKKCIFYRGENILCVGQ